MLRAFAAALVLLLLACVGPPGAPAPGRSSVFGEVRLVPREGVTPGAAGAGAYGDRRLRDVEFVDYSRPGFAVVYAEGPAPGGRAQLAIRGGAVRTRLEPEHAALGSRGSIAVENASDAAHVVSLPGVGFVHRLAPGEVAEVPVGGAGEQEVFLLDVPGAEARVFAAPGPYTVVSDSGRYALRDLEPGPHRLAVWHPRFPPVSRVVDLPADAVVRVDLELGVDQPQQQGGGDAAAP
jgi:hypothetical protein